MLSEDIYVCCIGHAFGKVPLAPGEPAGEQVYFVTDFLVDQSQSTGGGSFLQDPIQFDLTQSWGYGYRVLVPCGKKCYVKFPPKVAPGYFSAYLGRQVISGLTGGYFVPFPSQITFEGLVGPSPNFTYSNFSLTQADNEALIFEVEGDFSSSLQFDALLLNGSYGQRAFDPGAKWYSPLSYAVPLGTKDIYPKSETFVAFGYNTLDPVDLGPFVTIA